MKLVQIYCLIDPRNHAIRYVGKSVRPRNRVQEHCVEFRGRARALHKQRWVAELLKEKLIPILKVIDTVATGEDWEEIERLWIKYFKHTGCNLTNATLGGEGGEKSLELRRRMSISVKERLRTRPELLEQVIELGKQNAKPIPDGFIRVYETRPDGRQVPEIGQYRNCEACGSKFFARIGNIKRGWGKRCSRKCAIVGNFAGDKNPAWKDGTSGTPEYQRQWRKKKKNLAPLEIIKNGAQQ